MYSTIFTNIGLIADIVGAILIFKFGLPSVETRNLHLLVLSHPTDVEKKENSFASVMSYAGITILIIGFFLQLIGSIISV